MTAILKKQPFENFQNEELIEALKAAQESLNDKLLAEAKIRIQENRNLNQQIADVNEVLRRDIENIKKELWNHVDEELSKIKQQLNCNGQRLKP